MSRTWLGRDRDTGRQESGWQHKHWRRERGSGEHGATEKGINVWRENIRELPKDSGWAEGQLAQDPQKSGGGE